MLPFSTQVHASNPKNMHIFTSIFVDSDIYLPEFIFVVAKIQNSKIYSILPIRC